MTDQLSLSDIELQVLINLLEDERRELPSEIRRTDSIKVHDDLQQRLKMIDSLIDKLRHAPVH